MMRYDIILLPRGNNVTGAGKTKAFSINNFKKKTSVIVRWSKTGRGTRSGRHTKIRMEKPTPRWNIRKKRVHGGEKKKCKQYQRSGEKKYGKSISTQFNFIVH